MKRYLWPKTKYFIVLWVLFFFFFSPLQTSAQKKFNLDKRILAQAEIKYGPDARKRLVAWQDLVLYDISDSDEEKLDKVNAFFNQLEFVNDIDHWGKEDYWATPVEFIASNGGDCEDFSVAKYFTLKALGIPEIKLSLTYVKALSLDQAHMVLTYYESPDAVPLVLDNLIDEIKPAYKRADLSPVYSFNGTGLWIAKHRGRGQFVGKSEKLERWKELLERMPRGLI